MSFKGPRGKCPYCGRKVAVRKDGRTHVHQVKGTGRTCPGSGARAT